jgi:hypothetical protein
VDEGRLGENGPDMPSTCLSSRSITLSYYGLGGSAVWPGENGLDMPSTFLSSLVLTNPQSDTFSYYGLGGSGVGRGKTDLIGIPPSFKTVYFPFKGSIFKTNNSSNLTNRPVELGSSLFIGFSLPVFVPLGDSQRP